MPVVKQSQLMFLPVMVWLVSSCVAVNAADWRSVSRPQLSETSISLTVGYAINPRLPAWTDQQLAELLNAATQIARQHFAVEVSFKPIQRVSLKSLFDGMATSVRKYAEDDIFRPSHGPAGRREILNTTFATLRAQGQIESLIVYANEHLRGLGPIDDLESLSVALTQRHLGGLQQWSQLLGGDEQPLLADDDYHQWALWSALGYSALPFDVVLTNQLVASAEYSGTSLHSALRGGVSVGSTFYNRHSDVGSYVMFSTLAFDDSLAFARQEGAYGPLAPELAGAYLAHELGHQLLHLGHPYANTSCVMTPASVFQFRAWFDSIDALACPVGAQPQMIPGAISLRFDADLAE